MAKEIIRFILFYIVCACVGALAQGCKSSKTATDYEQAGTLAIETTDTAGVINVEERSISVVDTTIEERVTSLIESIDEEVTWTLTTYDTERTDSDGTHPVKSVGVLSKKKHTGRDEMTESRKETGHEENIDNKTTEEATKSNHKVISADESAKYTRVSETKRPLSSPIRLALFLAILGGLGYLVIKYGRKFW